MRQPLSKQFICDKFGTFYVSYNIMRSEMLLGIHNRKSQENLNYIVEKVLECENFLTK